MDKRKKIDLILLLIYPIIGVAVSHLLNINAFCSVLVFFGIPSFYLSIRAKKYSKKAAIFSILASLPLIIIIDYIAHSTGQWVIPNSILPRVFQYVTIEVIIWAIFNCYFVIIFYEYFLDHHFTKKLVYPQMKYLVGLFLALFVLFLFVYNFSPLLLNIPYFYLCFGVAFILIPIIIQFFARPKLITKFFETAAYFFYVTFLYEITALQLGWWGFPGRKFIGWISIFDIKFPLEELIFWLLLLAMAMLTYYEFFDDDEK